MTALGDWAVGALLGSSILMLGVLAVRNPVRRWVGPTLGYALWALPVVRMIVPALPAGLFAALPATTAPARWSVLVVGARGSGLWLGRAAPWHLATVLLAVWLTGASVLLGAHIVRYVRFRERLLASATPAGRHGTIRVVRAAVAGPLAFGVVHRFIAIPDDFADRYTPREQDLALAHEYAHHARGDLVANWVSLAMLVVHWWNPVAWAAIRAFRDDQEFAVDAVVVARCDPDARPAYAHVLAKAAGLGGFPVCNLTPRSNLKGRLTMLKHSPLTAGRRFRRGTAGALLAAGALVATVSVAGAAEPDAGQQAVTIGVKPDGAGGYALIVGDASVAPGAPLPGGATLPADFSPHGGCDLRPSAVPNAMVIKGLGGNTTYTVMCGSAKPAATRATLDEGLASLKRMRASVAAQHSAVFPAAERRHALGAIDRSIHAVEATLAKTS